MKIFIPEHKSGAGHFIYKGYASAWKSIGFDVEEYASIGPHMKDMGNEVYDVMLVDGSFDTVFAGAKRFIDRARRVYLFVQPDKMPKPWGDHPNFYSHSSPATTRYFNRKDNIFYWSFVEAERTDWYKKWDKKIHYVPLAFDHINYPVIDDPKCNVFDVSYIGGKADNGFNEKWGLMQENFNALEGLEFGIFVESGIDIPSEAKVLRNSKVSINIHDVYQRKFGFDTNERTFKALGLNGVLVSDHVDCIKRLFPNLKMANSPEEMRELVDSKLEIDNSVERNYYRQLILSKHTYVHRALTLNNV